MNTKIYLLPFLMLALLFASCEETKEAGKFDNWRARNDAFIDSLQNVYDTKPDHGGLEKIDLISAPDQHIFYKTLTPVSPDGKEPIITDISPLYTESVSIYYRGSYINGDILDQNFTGANPSFDFDSPSIFLVGTILNDKGEPVSGVVVGLAEMLQKMKVGERRLIYIPWRFGYGEYDYAPRNSTITIPGESTLIYDTQLLSIENQETFVGTM